MLWFRIEERSWRLPFQSRQKPVLPVSKPWRMVALPYSVLAFLATIHKQVLEYDKVGFSINILSEKYLPLGFCYFLCL